MYNIHCNILTYHSVVKEIQCDLQDGEDNYTNSRRDDQGVGGGEGGLLLFLDTNCMDQEFVPPLYLVI